MSEHVNKINYTNGKVDDGTPQVVIVEQPSSKGLRFRYECEKKYATTIMGVNSNDNQKSYPTIQILNCKGPVRIVVSCVTKNPPYRPHPHNLLGKIKVANGICQFNYIDTGPALCFENLSIQCVKKMDVAKSLALRKKLGVDPFKTGFDHASNPSSIDLYSLRLCIEVFIEGKTPGVLDVPLQPVVTDPVYDRRNKKEPEIVYITRKEGPVGGGDELGILCERADRDDIQVLFYRVESNWTRAAKFCKLGVFKRVAIVIKTPPYEDEDVTEPVKVNIILQRKSNGDASESFSYTYLPAKRNPLKRKRDEYASCESLHKAIEENAAQVLPKNMDSCSAFNLPAREGKDNDDRGELKSVTDLSANAHEYSDPHSPTSENSPKNKTYVNNFHNENSFGIKDSPEHRNYSDTLNSDDWVHDLLLSIDGDSMLKKESEIEEEPDIKYIIPDPIPNITNSIPAVQNHNNYIANNHYNQGTPSVNVPVFMEEVEHLPEHFVTDMNNLGNIHKLREQPSDGIPQGFLMHGQHPEYDMGINENQWSNALNNNVTNRQPSMSNDHQYLPAQPENISQMCVDDDFHGHSNGNYTMDQGSYGTPMQSFNQENTWHQIQRETLNEFDPLCPISEIWAANHPYNNFDQ